MKKILVLVGVLLMGLGVFASDTEEVKQFFNSYVESGNTYKSNFFDYYVPNPVITRVVIKKDGTTKSVKVPIGVFKKQTRLGARLGKIRGYKNIYTNIQIVPEGANYRVTAMRQPSTSTYTLPASFLIGKDDSGKWKIKEESMQTKVQTFLRGK